MSKSATRDYQFDTIKGLMIFLVVLCHFLSHFQAHGVTGAAVTKYLYYEAYSFHMAVFVFISGYFSKRTTDYKTYIKKAIAGCLVPYLIFNSVYGFFFHSFQQAIDIWHPQYTLWFLLSLFWWKLIVEVVARFKKPIAILIGFLFPLYVGMFPDVGHFLSLSRTICFFPFFLVGYLTPADTVRKIREKGKALPIVVFLLSVAAIGLITYYDFGKIGTSVLYMNSAYKSCHQTTLMGMVMRCVILMAGFAAIYFFVAVIPAKQNLLSTLGRGSLTVYLAHSGVIRLLEKMNVPKIDDPYVCLVSGIVFAAVVCALFGNKGVAKAFSTVMNKINTLLLEPAKEAADRRDCAEGK